MNRNTILLIFFIAASVLGLLLLSRHIKSAKGLDIGPEGQNTFQINVDTTLNQQHP